jgi:hypothetical protein
MKQKVQFILLGVLVGLSFNLIITPISYMNGERQGEASMKLWQDQWYYEHGGGLTQRTSMEVIKGRGVDAQLSGKLDECAVFESCLWFEGGEIWYDGKTDTSHHAWLVKVAKCTGTLTECLAPKKPSPSRKHKLGEIYPADMLTVWCEKPKNLWTPNCSLAAILGDANWDQDYQISDEQMASGFALRSQNGKVTLHPCKTYEKCKETPLLVRQVQTPTSVTVTVNPTKEQLDNCRKAAEAVGGTCANE